MPSSIVVLVSSYLLLSLQIRLGWCAIVSSHNDSRISPVDDKLHQPLSPYELSMLGDLVIEICNLKCSSVSPTKMKSLKGFLFSAFSDAPSKAIAHPLFYANYRSLVDCMSYVHDTERISSHVHDKEDDFATRRSRRMRRASITTEESQEFNSLIPTGEEGYTKFHSGPSFSQLFHSLQNIVEVACPPNLKANRDFLSASFREAVAYVNSHELRTQAYNKYLSDDDGGLIVQLDMCYQGAIAMS